MEITAFSLGERFIGIKESLGIASNPHILAMLRLDDPSVADDETPWCSAWLNYIAWLLRLPRSKSLSARSWLRVGAVVPELRAATCGFDVVILKRGGGHQPGPEVLQAPGHVGLFSAIEGDNIWLLGGNQNDMVSLAPFPISKVIGVRRLGGQR